MIEINNDQKVYVTFLLGADDFEISHLLREKAHTLGMDTIYDICDHIATLFCKYDLEENSSADISEYDSLRYFLRDFDNDLKEYINNYENN